jgi:hypothetical protein
MIETRKIIITPRPCSQSLASRPLGQSRGPWEWLSSAIHSLVSSSRI